jgi:hypothetical protein
MRHPAQLTRLTREEDANLVGLLNRKSAQNEGVCFVQRHKIFDGTFYLCIQKTSLNDASLNRQLGHNRRAAPSDL